MGDVKEFAQPFGIVTNKENPPFWSKSGDQFDKVTKGIPSINENECIEVYGSYTSPHGKKSYLTSNGTDDIWIHDSDLNSDSKASIQCNQDGAKQKNRTRSTKKRKTTTSKRPRRSKRLAEKKRKSKRV